MSRTVKAQGANLQDALEAAVGELLDEGDGVEVRLAGGDHASWSGSARLELEVAAAAPSDGEGSDEPVEAAEPVAEGEVISAEELDEEADAAADFMEGLLDALDLPGDLRIKLHPDHAELEVIEIGSGALIGRRGQTLDAIQELVRCSLQRQFQRRARIKIDAEGYRARRLEKLLEKADEAIDAVLDSGEAERLEPMDVFERKAVHQLVAEVDGLQSRSQGREPARRVVIEPA
ncbi:MAG: R3H domain-containing nucleic acid-binding protein [Nitriliruptoraceae bacterium]